MPAVLQTKNLTFTYGGNGPFRKTAVSDVSISIEQGEFIGVIGPVSYTHLDVYKRQPRGRCVTRAAYLHLGMTPPGENSPQQSFFQT